MFASNLHHSRHKHCAIQGKSAASDVGVDGQLRLMRESPSKNDTLSFTRGACRAENGADVRARGTNRQFVTSSGGRLWDRATRDRATRFSSGAAIMTVLSHLAGGGGLL
jgi:hypothetical protein